jgi:hypothetical protein
MTKVGETKNGCRLKVKVVAKKPVWGVRKRSLRCQSQRQGQGKGKGSRCVCLALLCVALVPSSFLSLSHTHVLYTPPSGFSSSGPRHPTSKQASLTYLYQSSLKVYKAPFPERSAMSVLYRLRDRAGCCFRRIDATRKRNRSTVLCVLGLLSLVGVGSSNRCSVVCTMIVMVIDYAGPLTISPRVCRPPVGLSGKDKVKNLEKHTRKSGIRNKVIIIRNRSKALQKEGTIHHLWPFV